MLVYIKPLTLFPEIHSDTLFGALCSAISNLYPYKMDDMISNFLDNNPPFIISSPLPYIYDEEKIIRLYPKIHDSSDKRYDSNKLKQYKTIQYFDEATFIDYIKGDITESDLIDNIDKLAYNNIIFQDDYNINFSCVEKILPGNNINRLTNSSENIYYTSGYEYSDMGLYFFIKFFDKEYERIVTSAIKYLKDAGLGKDISIGKGQFDYFFEENNQIENIIYYNKGMFFTTLSRYIPTENELKNITNKSYYDITSKRGRSSNGEIRRKVTFFTEGSTFFNNNQEFYGKIIESGIVNPSVEYGYAFVVKINRSVF